MALAADTFEAEISVEENISFRLLEQRTGQLQSDFAEIKTVIGRLDTKLENTRDMVVELRTDVERGFSATNQRLTELTAAGTLVNARLDRLEEKFDEGFETLDRKIDANTLALDRKIDEKFETLDRKIDEKFETLDRKIDANTLALDRKIDEKFETLDRKIDANTLTLDRKIDEKFETLDGKIDVTAVALDRKIDQSRNDLMTWANAQFDRKLFRALSVLVGAMASIGMLVSVAEKMSLGIQATVGIAIVIPAVLITATFLVTRASR